MICPKDGGEIKKVNEFYAVCEICGDEYLLIKNENDLA